MSQCECADPGCPVHRGRNHCSNRGGVILYRSDMDDETGTDMCEDCADDAMESGMYYSENVTTASVGNPTNKVLADRGTTKRDETMQPNRRRVSHLIESVSRGANPRSAVRRFINARLGEADGDAAADDLLSGRDRGSDPMDVQSRVAQGDANAAPAGINVGPGPNALVAGDGRDHPESPGTGPGDVGVQAADSETAEGKQLDRAGSPGDGEFMENRRLRRRIAERLDHLLGEDDGTSPAGTQEEDEETGTKPWEGSSREGGSTKAEGRRRRFRESEGEDDSDGSSDGTSGGRNEGRSPVRRYRVYEEGDGGPEEFDTPDWESGGAVEDPAYEDEEGDAAMSTTLGERRRPTKRKFKKTRVFREDEEGDGSDPSATTPEGAATTRVAEARRRRFFEDEDDDTSPAGTQEEDEETGTKPWEGSSKKEDRRRPVREFMGFGSSDKGSSKKEGARGRGRRMVREDDADTDDEDGATSSKTESQRLSASLSGMNEARLGLNEGPFGLQHARKKVAGYKKTARSVGRAVHRVASRGRHEALTEGSNPIADYYTLGSPVTYGGKDGKITEVYEAPGGFDYIVTFPDGGSELLSHQELTRDRGYNPDYYN